MNYQRVVATLTLKVSASADAFFKQLMLWDSIVGWKDSPVALAKVELAPGHKLGQLPCTRFCYVDLTKLPADLPRDAVPEKISETLLASDTVARTCLYILDGTGPSGMRNYFATTEVDEVGPNIAKVTCTGRCDLPLDGSAEMIRSLLTETYRLGVIGGTAGMIGATIV